VFSNLSPGNDSFAAIRCNGNIISELLLSNGRLALAPLFRLLAVTSQLQCFVYNVMLIIQKLMEFRSTLLQFLLQTFPIHQLQYVYVSSRLEQQVRSPSQLEDNGLPIRYDSTFCQMNRPIRDHSGE
jgi:hypothetical protein